MQDNLWNYRFINVHIYFVFKEFELGNMVLKFFFKKINF